MLFKWQPRDGQTPSNPFSDSERTGMMSCTASKNTSPKSHHLEVQSIILIILFDFSSQLAGTFRDDEITPMIRQVTQRIIHPGVQGCCLCSIAGGFEWLPGRTGWPLAANGWSLWLSKKTAVEHARTNTFHIHFIISYQTWPLSFQVCDVSELYDLCTF